MICQRCRTLKLSDAANAIEVNGMTFGEAVEALKNGKKIKYKSWGNTWIWLEVKGDKNVILKHEKKNISTIHESIPVDWLMLDGWEEIGSD